MHLIGKSPGKPCVCSVVRCLCVWFSQVFFIAVFALFVPCFAMAPLEPELSGLDVGVSEEQQEQGSQEQESQEQGSQGENQASPETVRAAALMTDDAEVDQYVKYDALCSYMGWYSEDAEENKKEACNSIQGLTDALAENLQELRDNAREMEENEQSLENRTLTAVTTAAVGIGGMELARGLSEQKADENAESDMMAYIETMRCSYGDKRVKAGPTEIELPGGNDANIMKYRNEYFALAKDLKERKAALGMKPGIESEEILEKTQMGLYDDENTGITAGAYESWYRAQMLESEKDKQRIAEMKEASSKRVKGGAIAAGAGMAVGLIGNLLLNRDKHDKSAQILAKRDQIKSKMTNLFDEVIMDCNAKIEIEKAQVEEQKQTEEYKTNPDFRKHIEEIEKLDFLKYDDDDELYKLEGHPVCG